MGWNKNTEELSISINLSACLSAVLDVNLHVYTPQGILIYIKHGFYKSSSVSFIDNESHLRTKKNDLFTRCWRWEYNFYGGFANFEK